MLKRPAAIAIALVLAAGGAATAAEETTSLTRAEADGVLKRLDETFETYPFQEAAPKARAVLKAKRADYLAISDRQVFAERLTADVGSALGDKHFYVRVKTSAPPPVTRGVEADTSEAAVGYGIASVSVLPGNVGYIDLRQFAASEKSIGRVDAAMELMADTVALIIDLRANRGGSDAAMNALIGRLASRPIPRSVLIFRRPGGGEDRMENANRAYPAEKLFARPVFLLTSNRTISAAEAFAYDLQAAGRATVVGEVTRGGAAPMNRPLYDLGAGLSAYVPTGRAEHPLTKTSPNGVGVAPDVAVAASDALEQAYRLALAEAPALDEGTAAAKALAAAKADPSAALKTATP